MNSEFRAGATELLRGYVEVAPGETLFCPYDVAVSATAEGIRAEAQNLDLEVEFFELDDATGVDSLMDRMVRYPVSLFLQANKSYFPNEVVAVMRNHPDLRVFRFFGARPEAVATGFKHSKEYLRKLNWALIRKIHRVGEIEVRSASGTDLRIGLDPTIGWTSTYGSSLEHEPKILPPAEINTLSDRVDGTLVVDGVIQASIAWPLDPRCLHAPLRMTWRDGKVVDLECADGLVLELVEDMLRVTSRQPFHEIGIGTNRGLTSFIDSDVLLNERFPSFHLGVGPVPENPAGLHADFILGHSEIWAGGELLVRDGEFFVDPEVPADDLPGRPAARIVALADIL